MLDVLSGLKRLTYRIQPISHIQKREKRKKQQEDRKTYHEVQNYISKIRKDMGYSDGREWQA